MKIWNSYGSEYSANLVIIGKFKDAASAKEAMTIIGKITEFMANTDDDHEDAVNFSDAALDFLKTVKFYSVRPAELAQFRYDINSERRNDQIIITTDELDVSAFLKLLIDKGARVEMYSAHDYPNTNEGR